MNKTINWLAQDHRKYEAILEECKMAADAGDWEDAIRLFHDFAEVLKLEMHMEDEVLYPAFVEEVENSAEPIAELSEEHQHIVQLLQDLDYVIKRNDVDHFEESLKPLYRTLNLHYEHEEEIFFSLGNDFLLMTREEIMARFKSLKDRQIHCD